MTESQSTVEWYASQFAHYERTLNGEAGTAFHSLRRDALARFAGLGFPTTRDEEWRFTNIAPIARTPFTTAAPESVHRVTLADIEEHLLSHPDGARVVFVNGYWSPDLTSLDALPAGVRVESIAMAVRRGEAEVLAHLNRLASGDRNAFTALQTAFMRDGLYVVVPDGLAIDEPLHVIFVSTEEPMPFAAHPRVLIRAGADSRLAIVETYLGRGSGLYLTNMVTEIFAGLRAVVEHDKVQLESPRGYHIGSVYIHQEGGSRVTSNSIAIGGALVRNNVTSILAGPDADCTLNGLSLAAGTQLIDNHTTIDHAHPLCTSHELYKAILDGASRGVFNGKIFVRKDAQKTDAKQTNKTLLLSDDATIDTKPQLEIFADDVKCTHGATIGQLDEEQVFYLRSRGIGEQDARDILTYAFAGDVINRVHVESLRGRLEAILHARLQQGRITL